MQINLETDERTGKLRGADGQESHNLHTLTGKYEITEAAIELRWDAESETYVNPENVTYAAWKGQEENTLYNVFNRVQEGILRGGRYDFYARNKNGDRTKVRPVKSLVENERLNKALWSLTSKMAELKGYRAEFRNGMLN